MFGDLWMLVSGTDSGYVGNTATVQDRRCYKILVLVYTLGFPELSLSSCFINLRTEVYL
jgi:hypothetical protein